MRRHAGWFIALALVAGLAGESRAAKVVILGTGGVTGVYYPAGGAVCRLVNAATEFHGIRCLVESTGGSVDNTERVLSGDLDFGMVQSDVQWKAVRGEPPFKEPQEKLRSVFSLYPETATLVARADSPLRSAEDLPGRRINLGSPGSGTLATAIDALTALGMVPGDLGQATHLGLAEQERALLAGEIDGFFMLAGHPSQALLEVAFRTDLRFVPLAGPGIEALLARHPFYVRAETPGGIYRGIADPVPTFAVKATLVTSTRVADTVVFNVVKSVFVELEALRQMHPALHHLRAEDLLTGLTAPLHDGACRYFETQGMTCPE